MTDTRFPRSPGFCQVEFPIVDQDAVCTQGMLRRYLFILPIMKHQLWIAFKRIAMAATRGLLMQQSVAAGQVKFEI